MSERFNAPLIPHKHYFFKLAIKRLSYLAHHARHDSRLIIKIITTGGIDATEQIYLLEFYYRCAGLIKPKHNYRPVTLEEEQKIIKLYNQGIPLLHIAKKLNRHVSTVYYVVQRNKSCTRRV